MATYAILHPSRIVPYGRRWARDVVLGLQTDGHVAYYRAIMHSNVSRGPEVAVGCDSHESWIRHGQMQFDYLLDHGVSPGMRVLEIGCGNLRAGRLLIDHLETGNYYGIDISPDILMAALDTISEFGLQAKLPRLALVHNLKLDFLPPGTFDVVHAHSVFSHCPIEVIDQCLRNVGRIMAPAGFFDFTFNRTERAEHQVLREDFYYRTETLTALAARYGLQARLMSDWGPPRSSQSKLRVTQSDPSFSAA